MNNSNAQQKKSTFVDENSQLNYSDLDSWYVRKVKESSVLSGNTIELPGVGRADAQANVFDPKLKDPKSPWGLTNIYSKMVVDIANACVFPEKRGNGYCSRLETRIRKDKIIGFSIEVLVSGTLFLGEMIEPVRNTKDPIKKMNQGIPFDKRPEAIKFDYKHIPGKNRVKADSGTKPVSGPDRAELCLILQKRWEDDKGNVFATRVGGTRQFFDGTNGQWINGANFPIYYGDITNLPEYDAKTMGLIPEVSLLYVKNSKNLMVPLTETGWGKSNEIPTHLILYFNSSYQGIEYIGSPESKFWIDNIELVY